MTRRPGGRPHHPNPRSGRGRRRRPPRDMFDVLVDGMAETYDQESPAMVELYVATLLAERPPGMSVDEAVAHNMLPELLLRPGRGALATLLTIAVLTEGKIARAARIAATGLIAEGVDLPPWAEDLRQPMTATACVRLVDEGPHASLLATEFRRGGHTHGALLAVNHLLDGQADQILIITDAATLAEAIEDARSNAQADGHTLTEASLDAARWRWYAQEALDAREENDQLDDEEPEETEDEEEVPSYAASALTLRAWLRHLPPPRRP